MNTLVKISPACTPGFAFDYRGHEWTFEGFGSTGTPYFACKGVVLEHYSSSIETACANAWEARGR